MVKLLIGADICPIENNLPHFHGGNANALFGDLLPEFDGSDLVMANLECPFVKGATPISKTGPTFGAPGECINAIKAAGFDVLCLANNHIMDHGPAGLENTLAVCERAGIATVGAGRTLSEARRILIRRISRLRVGILALAEHEFSVTTNGSCGANPLDLIDFVRNVNSSRKEFDYLVVLFHGGDEFCVPSPRIKDTCHFMIEMGANAVIVQHPHVLGGCEEYRGGHIVYGQGALIMDEPIYRERQSFHEGFLVRLNIADDATSKMELIPFTQSDPTPGARKMSPERERVFRQALDERSRAILDDAYVEEQWMNFCEKNKHGYVSGVLGHNRVLRKLNKTGILTRILHGERPMLGVRNLVCCETHREALETIFTRKMS